MKQYPIWNIVTACIYKSGKSYGVKERGEVVREELSDEIEVSVAPGAYGGDVEGR